MKPTLPLLTAFLLATSSALLTTTITQAALVAHWAADGDYTDSSLNGGHHGTPFGDTTFASGAIGQAFDFDGTQDFIDVAHHTDFNFGTGDFSVTFRVNFDSIVSGANGLIDKDTFLDPSDTEYKGWLFNISDPSGGAGMETRDVPGVRTNNRFTGYTTGTWYNITGVRKDNVLLLYIDGEFENSIAEAIPTNVDNLIDLKIGALSDRITAQALDGRLDDIAIFNHALSQTEVTNISDGGVTNVPEPSRTLLSLLALTALVAIRRRARSDG